MGHLYISLLSNGKYYVGSTNNLEVRIQKHKEGKSTYTSKYLPIKLVFSKNFPTLKEARLIETKLKKMKSRKIIEKIVKNQKLTISVGKSRQA